MSFIFWPLICLLYFSALFFRVVTCDKLLMSIIGLLPDTWGQVGWMLADHRDGLSSSSFLAWSSIAQSVCQWAISLLAIWCLRPWWVRILLSAEEDNLSPFDSNVACLCQSIEINNNKHVCNVCMYACMHLCVGGWFVPMNEYIYVCLCESS